ncbi:hypothetical protein [Streptomyces mirabilis]
MTEPATLASRSVILALQEITEDLVSTDGGLAVKTEDEAVELIDMLLGHTDGPSSTAPLLEDDGLALAAARRLLAALAEDPDTRALTEPLLADPPTDEQMAVVEVSSGLVALYALVAFAQTKLSIKSEWKSRRGKVTFELTKEAAKTADLYRQILNPSAQPPTIDPAPTDPGQGPTDPPTAP